MDQTPGLQNLLFNIVYQVLSPNREDRVPFHQLIGILFLVNLMGIVSYMNSFAPGPHINASSLPVPLGSSEGESGTDLLGNLLNLIGNRKGGPSGLQDLNPQSLALLLNLLSSLGQQRKRSDEEPDTAREPG